ncbi:hypothetical protein GGR56DRAFT_611966 [Xylariaceae sp. FL0804]|nr:hypothetical protein GGR56DRAFT_611966 [Xylariaceae sp. FL0804]
MATKKHLLSPWSLEGNDRSRFRAYATLLHLRNNGQIQGHQSRPAEDDSLEEDAFDDSGTTSPDILTFFDEKSLKDGFLDRIAEIASRAKGGQHVTASVMREGQGGVELMIARNEGFKHDDAQFFGDIESFMCQLALNNDPALVAQMYNAILGFQTERIRFWLDKFRTESGSIFFSEAVLARIEKTSGTRARELYIALVMIKALIFASFKSGDMKLTGVISELSRTVWESFPVTLFEEIGISGARRLLDTLGYLGRLNAACNTIVRACRRLPGFRNLRIRLLHCESMKLREYKHFDQRHMNPKLWPIHRTCKSLVPDAIDIKRFVGGKWAPKSAMNKFESLKRESPQIHAEVQLLLHLTEIEDPQETEKASEWSTYNYIGCSKRSCFLCSQFIQQHDPAFRTRGSHGNIFSQWTVPIFETVTGNHNIPTRMARALRRIEEKMVSLAVEDVRSDPALPAIAQSSVGGSSCATTTLPGGQFDVSKWTQLLVDAHISHEGELSQQMSKSRVATGHEEEVDEGRHVDYESLPDLVSTPPDESSRGEKYATIHHLRSSCSARPLNPTDYLSMAITADEIPDDPDVLERFGFNQCRDHHQESFLLGIYKGLLDIMMVPNSTVNSWMENGTLRANIIKVYETLPETSRGKYFPWFLKHTYVLNPSPQADDSPRLSGVEQSYADAFSEVCQRHLSIEDQKLPSHELQPIAKLDCLIMFSLLLKAGYPNPNMTNLWFNFGFCVCLDRYHQGSLGSLYHRMLYGGKMEDDINNALGLPTTIRPPVQTCSFEDFLNHFQEGTLPSLIKRYRGRDALDQFPHLEEFLSIPPSQERPAVWHLKHLIELGDDISNAYILPSPEKYEMETARQVFSLDRSTSRLDAKETMILRDFYKTLLFSPNGGKINPLELERARVQGGLLEFLQQACLDNGRVGNRNLELERVLDKAFS